MSHAPNRGHSDLSRRLREGPVTPQCPPSPLPTPRAPAVTHGSRKGCPGLAPTCPSQPKASPGWAGNLCMLRQEKRHREFRGVWTVHGTWPRALSHSLPVAAQCPHGCVLTRGGHSGQAAPEPGANRYGSGPGQPLCPPALPLGSGTEEQGAPAARCPAAHRPGAPEASRSVTRTRRQKQAPDPEVVPED